MAVAAPARKTAPAPGPSRTAAPTRPAPARRRPLRPTRTKVASRGAAVTAPAPARKAPKRKAPARKPVARSAAPARQAPRRKAPSRARSFSQRAVAGGQLIPIAAGRTAVAVRQLPDSGLVVRMTRGRAWIAVLGLLLVGIVALNVATLGFAASAGQIDSEITALEREIGVISSRDAQLSGTARVRGDAAALGLTMPASDQIHFTQAGPQDIATAAQRLAAAGG